MSQVEMCIVDIEAMCRRLNPAGPFSAMVLETWLTKLYVNAHSVPCVSATLLDKAPPSGFMEDRHYLVRRAAICGIDPLKFLPHPREYAPSVRGLTFFVSDGLLYMGDYRAIEQIRRRMHSGYGGHRFLDIA